MLQRGCLRYLPLRREIVDLRGTAQVMRSEALVGASDLIDMYNAARDEEYAEIIDKCRDFLNETKTKRLQGISPTHS